VVDLKPIEKENGSILSADGHTINSPTPSASRVDAPNWVQGERQIENYQMHLPSTAFQADSPKGELLHPPSGRVERSEGRVELSLPLAQEQRLACVDWILIRDSIHVEHKLSARPVCMLIR